MNDSRYEYLKKRINDLEKIGQEEYPELTQEEIAFEQKTILYELEHDQWEQVQESIKKIK